MQAVKDKGIIQQYKYSIPCIHDRHRFSILPPRPDNPQRIPRPHHPHHTKQALQTPRPRRRRRTINLLRLLRLPITQLNDLNPLPPRKVQKVAHHLQPLALVDPQPPAHGFGREAAVADGQVDRAAGFGSLEDGLQDGDGRGEVVDRHDARARVQELVVGSADGVGGAQSGRHVFWIGVEIDEEAAVVEEAVGVELGFVHAHAGDSEGGGRILVLVSCGGALDGGRVVADPGRAEVEDAAFGWEGGGVVGSERSDCRVVDVGYEARRAVEVGVGGGVLSGEVGRVVGPLCVAGGVRCYAVRLVVGGSHVGYFGGC